LAIELASSCDHPDARWLSEACNGKDVKTRRDAQRVFLALGPDDARALCFAWVFEDDEDEREDLTPLRRSAELGFAYSLALIARELRETDGDERFKFAQLAAAQGERDGFTWLGMSFRFGDGCERDLDKAKENFLRASKLGHVAAMGVLGDLMDASNMQRWQWWGRAAGCGNGYHFLSNFVKEVELKCCCHVCNRTSFARTCERGGENNFQEQLYFRISHQFGKGSACILRG
jgi:TPR repeat protein